MNTLFQKLFFIFFITSITFAADWPQIQHDAARSGFAADTNAGPKVDITLDTEGDSPGNDSYQIAWRWYPYTAADSNHHTSICGLVQPVIKDNVLCVGYYDGKMYGVDATIGTQIWEFQTDGPILHTAGFAGDVVIFGSQDRKVYGLNAKTGTKIWELKTGYPVRTAPCIFNNICYIGSTDGKLYAINALTGTKIWEYDSGAPILTTASCDETGNIYCGNEALYAFSVNSSGTERWKKRLKGQSLMSYWPVVNSSKSQVIFRTQPIRDFHYNLGSGDTALRYDANGNLRANTSLSNYVDGVAFGDILPEQQRIRNYIISNPIHQTSFILSTETGTEISILPIFYTSGEGTVPTPPVIDSDSGSYITFWRSYYSVFDSPSIVRPYTTIGKLDPDTLNISHIEKDKSHFRHFRVIGDETAIFSAMEGYLFVSCRGLFGGIRLSDEASFHVVCSERVEAFGGKEPVFGTPFAYDGTQWPEGSILGGGGQGGGLVSAPAIADGKLFWVARWGLIIALEPK